MAKAYQCDNCLECYPGDPFYKSTDGRYEFCPNCVRVMNTFKNFDPFDNRRYQEDKQKRLKDNTVTIKE